ncbi:MAG: hypothetical protein DCF19_09710 [Pseudanabaena frigida]|uniref:histidine kinase n=1 Tax=Pseudanabaena frigida TaxID=945775 RepID=A0A2W4WHM9_9CYAN|nr:MAG: hypothetical protein DCF19_09710 [Pseudanabaena frigida]
MHSQELHHAKEEKDSGNYLILLVDDNISNLKVLSLMLANKGYQVKQVISGIEALDFIDKQSPDIILLDILMPDIDGYEICTILKENPLTHSIPVIFVSSLANPSEKVKAFESGGVDYICKPFYLTEVLARVETHLQLGLLQKKLQSKNEQLLLSASLLSQSLEQEQIISQTKSSFVSSALHEFCATLTTIQSAAELLGYYEWTKEEKVEQLQQIQTEVSKTTLLMEDVSFLSSINANRLEINSTEFDVLGFCCQLLCQIQIDLDKNYNHTLQTSFSVPSENISIHNPHQLSSLPSAIVRMAKKLFSLIVCNLIINASICSPKGSNIDCQFIIHDGHIDIVVSDRGSGIDKDDLKNLFSAFNSGKNTDMLSGNVLALSIVKNCVDLHKGEISVKNRLNVGTEFTVTLPTE